MESNRIVVEVIDALDRLGVEWMLAGSYSSNFYGVARATRDADFVVQVQADTVQRLSAVLGGDFQIDPQMSFETVTGTYRYILRRRGSTFRVELFLLSADAHDQERFRRRRPTGFLGRTVQLPAAEDVVVTKLRWSQGGRRRKDVDDVRDVLAVQGSALDLDYTRRWCDQHGTRDLLEQLLTEPAP